MKPENMVGKKVRIIDHNSFYYNYWGYIKLWDGNVFHIEGGSISHSGSGECPIFDRDQFKIMK